jgi:hypothetical protein
MASFVYRCPNTSLNAQGWLADEPPASEIFDALTCVACRQVHFVNPRTGKVLGADEE